ncbi:MAG: hypothetical protein ACRENO_06515 [Thermodesulfobacteriota bacterium]
MFMKKEKMKCTDCGVDMNHHAEKINYSRVLVDSGEMDNVFGGMVEEIHTCPECGKSETQEEK